MNRLPSLSRLPSLIWRLTFVSVALIAIVLGARLHSITRTMNQTFRYDCTIKAVDSETYKPLKIAAANGPAINTEDLFNQSYSTTFTPEGALRISGIAYEPRMVGIAVDGYRAVAIKITSETQAQQDLPMTRVSENETK